MNPKLVLSAVTILGLLGWTVQSSLAVFEHGYAGDSPHYSSGHSCCEEIMRHGKPYAHAADHLRHVLKHEKEIGLTDEQTKKLKAIELEYDRTHIKAEAEIQIAERELQALVEDEKTELSAVEAKVKQSEMLEVGLRMTAFKARRDALAVLTPDQREKAKMAHEKRLHEMMMRGTHGAMPGKGY